MTFDAANKDIDCHKTLDGKRAFHGMGINATITPGIKTSKSLSHKAVNTDKIAAV